MATINGLYVFVQDESVDLGVESSSHAVELGIDLTDHVRRRPFQLSLKGEIVGPNANSTRTQIVNFMNTGALVTYVGRTYNGNMQIQTFKTTHPYTIQGGMAFEMVLKEVRIAQAAYQESEQATPTKPVTHLGTQQIEQNSSGEKVYHTVRAGETAWYLGEKVYKANGSSVGFITAQNPDAPQRSGDWTTLPIGAVLHVYNRKEV